MAPESPGTVIVQMSVDKEAVAVERLRDIWRSVTSAARRNHDPLLVYSMASFNFDGGARELLLKALPQNIWNETEND